MVDINSDILGLLETLNKHQVEYLVIGGYAFNIYAETRSTKDLDLLINPTLSNATKIHSALIEYDEALAFLQVNQFIFHSNYPVALLRKWFSDVSIASFRANEKQTPFQRTIYSLIYIVMRGLKKIYRIVTQFNAYLRLKKISKPRNHFVLSVPIRGQRVDFLKSLRSLKFESLYKNRCLIAHKNVLLPVVSIDDLIFIKSLANRRQDLKDIEKLKSMNLIKRA